MKKGEINNKSLVILLIAAMVVSLGGTFISLSRLGRIGAPYVTGRAESGTGEVKIEIASVLSIVLVDSFVDYGSCKPLSTGGKFMDSDGDNMWTDSGEEGKCTGADLKPNNPNGDFLVIGNDGNVEANVTIRTNDITLIQGITNNSLWFKTENGTAAGNDPGCYGLYQSWTNFTQTGADFPACDNLTADQITPKNKFRTAFRIWVPDTAGVGQDTATITFTANSVN